MKIPVLVWVLSKQTVRPDLGADGLLRSNFLKIVMTENSKWPQRAASAYCHGWLGRGCTGHIPGESAWWWGNWGVHAPTLTHHGWGLLPGHDFSLAPSGVHPGQASPLCQRTFSRGSQKAFGVFWDFVQWLLRRPHMQALRTSGPHSIKRLHICLLIYHHAFPLHLLHNSPGVLNMTCGCNHTLPSTESLKGSSRTPKCFKFTHPASA